MSRTSVRLVVVIASMLTLGAGLLIAAGATANQALQTPPIQLGTSGGNVNDISSMYCCSGTLGALVAKGGTQYILSNNHVLARSDQGQTGEDISQPGLVDTNCGTSAYNLVADLSAAAKLGSNVDAAIAQVRPGKVRTDGSILGVGVPSATMATAAPNRGVAKSGRTTGLTCASITSVNTSVNVQYETQCGGGSTFIVSYTGQVVVGGHGFSAGGDSGSLIVTSDTAQPIALLFAGSSTSTIGNPIQDVTKAMGVTFVGGGYHAVSGCSGGGGKKPRGKQLAAAHAAKEAHAARLMQDPAIMAVGVGTDDNDETEAVVVIYVEQGVAAGHIPAELDGVKTKIVRTDKIRAYGWNEQTRRSCGK